MDMEASADRRAATALQERELIEGRFKWDLTKIFADWEGWERACGELSQKIVLFAGLQGTLAHGADRLLSALRLRDDIGRLEYKVWYFASLWYDQDQRDNQLSAKRQRVEILFAQAAEASAWFDPELLAVPIAEVREWMAESAALAVYRFALEELYRQQEHVLDDKGERLLSLGSRFFSSPSDSYAALSTADLRHPVVRLPSGAEATLTSASTARFWRAIPARPIVRPPFTSITRSIRPTSIPTRRSTTACCSATGFTHRRADTRRRSMRPSTATMSPLLWSRT